MALTLNKVVNKSGGSYEPFPAGRYDGVLHAIISLEMQQHSFQGQDMGARPKVLLLFELPEVSRPAADGKQMPAMLSYEMTLSSSEKGTFMKVVNAIKHTRMTEDSLADLINEADGKSLKGMLGKSCVVEVKQFKNKHGDMKNAVAGIHELDPRLPQPKGVRDTFIFTVADPDLTVFKNVLIPWTRDKIMSAINADEFPAEVHEAYRDIKEQEAQNSGNRVV